MNVETVAVTSSSSSRASSKSSEQLLTSSASDSLSAEPSPWALVPDAKHTLFGFVKFGFIQLLQPVILSLSLAFRCSGWWHCWLFVELLILWGNRSVIACSRSAQNTSTQCIIRVWLPSVFDTELSEPCMSCSAACAREGDGTASTSFDFLRFVFWVTSPLKPYSSTCQCGHNWLLDRVQHNLHAVRSLRRRLLATATEKVDYVGSSSRVDYLSILYEH